MSRDDYVRWVVRPRLAQQKVTERLQAEVGQSTEQVRGAHILVDTQDLAAEIHRRVTEGGEDFATVAREASTDTATAPNGGDLGWFTRAEVVEPFANVAFGLEPNQISEPFQTEFGWHVLKVVERDDDRAMTDEQIQRVQDQRVQRWLEERRAEMDIGADIDPTPTPFAQPFQPPAQAPAAPTPTPIPAASPAP
jgi:peptidyl-prolyl cis-trans isomerase C